MSLKAFHLFFIIVSWLISLGMILWTQSSWAENISSGQTNLIMICGGIGLISLSIYFIKTVQKFKQF